MVGPYLPWPPAFEDISGKPVLRVRIKKIHWERGMRKRMADWSQKWEGKIVEALEYEHCFAILDSDCVRDWRACFYETNDFNLFKDEVEVITPLFLLKLRLDPNYKEPDGTKRIKLNREFEQVAPIMEKIYGYPSWWDE